jgi:DNA modification methylase
MNKLYYGDNLDVLRRFVRDESVDLCYIDPPFNSKRKYNQIYNIGQEDRASEVSNFTSPEVLRNVFENFLDSHIENE